MHVYASGRTCGKKPTLTCTHRCIECGNTHAGCPVVKYTKISDIPHAPVPCKRAAATRAQRGCENIYIQNHEIEYIKTFSHPIPYCALEAMTVFAEHATSQNPPNRETQISRCISQDKFEWRFWFKFENKICTEEIECLDLVEFGGSAI